MASEAKWGTRALVGHYTENGSWRAVWVHSMAYPEGLGADLVRAVALCGGDAQSVLDHVFSTGGWTSWPFDPHHPQDPDDRLFTPENVFFDFHWFYLFDLRDRRLDVAPADPTIVPEFQVRFDPQGVPSTTFGVSALSPGHIRSVWSYWRVVCPDEPGGALDAFLDALGVPSGVVGVGADPAEPAMRELLTTRRTLRFRGSGSVGSFMRASGRDVPLPRTFDWFTTNAAVWQGLAEQFGLALEVSGARLWHVQSVVAVVTDVYSEIGIEDAARFEAGVELGAALATSVRENPAEAVVFILADVLGRLRAALRAAPY